MGCLSIYCIHCNNYEYTFKGSNSSIFISDYLLHVVNFLTLKGFFYRKSKNEAQSRLSLKRWQKIVKVNLVTALFAMLSAILKERLILFIAVPVWDKVRAFELWLNK